MAVTKISDIFTPDIWNTYGVERTAELSAFFQSGVVQTVAGMVVPQGGGTINMPFFQDLQGDDEVLSDNTPLTAGNITTGKDIAAINGRGKAWGANDLAGVFAGADPVRAMVDLLAGYWARKMQKTLIATLNGATSASNFTDNVLDISGVAGTGANIAAKTLLDAFYRLGDNAQAVTAIAMHSKSMNKLLKDDLIDFIRYSDGRAEVPTYLGKRVIVDDGLPYNVATDTATTYIFGEGAVGYAEAVIGAADLEFDRDILAGDTIMAQRRRFVMHPRGIRWTGVPAGDFPTNGELATAGNYTRVYEAQNVRIVKFIHKTVAA